MAPARRSVVDESSTRTALLDATAALMLEEGYAAVTTRRLAQRAGVNNGLVYYYFGTMDGLYIELFRRGAERSLGRLKEALQAPQPLWSLWELTQDFSSNALTMEFIALANHRKAIRTEIAAYSRTFRTLQLDALSGVLASYGLDPQRWPPAALIVMIAAVSRFLHIEDGFDVDIGHMELITVIEREIRALEGDRGPTRETLAHQVG
ncbi:TetR/AcrR family transcriptional regulator [Frankia sp. AgB1.9]|uniref:TetR/AcrR family transcriptional regulator n=1 Tax=unclassified Frankia TaxID=2632575 RepID=UPI001933693D|nr:MULTISPECIES: TetR/AcrR family transcriptional regulator [unclassified Frankia]MBL7488361.1 TetR/AcrR family transcriptional regulator [Frankia sp. AgW1.1]MBL7547691.1 TetR/AcrR family transcriptional regulator [Frankia sp. AgB1.9]MBL7624064.1 TetR/AcrR family transcriptional regulator [Frankia sp. AgB1.8]